MTHFVRDHISLRELAGRAESPFQFIKEAQVDLHLLVAGSLERTCDRFRVASSPSYRFTVPPMHRWEPPNSVPPPQLLSSRRSSISSLAPPGVQRIRPPPVVTAW